MKFKPVVGLLKDTANGFLEDKALRLSAALAYYSIFSIAPLVIIVISVAGFFMGEEAVRQQILQQLREFVFERTFLMMVFLQSNVLPYLFNLRLADGKTTIPVLPFEAA